MLFDFSPSDPEIGDGLVLRSVPARWGVDSEHGRLRDVMLSPPPHLEIIPCNAVSIENLRKGIVCSAERAESQHAALVDALKAEGVRCHMVPPDPSMPDLCFTRDSTLMTPWGLLQLNPAVQHRQAEVAQIVEAARGWGVPMLGRLEEGRVEGGDVCILRPGLVLIGFSGERTDEAGAMALARLFERRGWQAILHQFDPHFLHLDTQLTMVDEGCAVACVDALHPDFVAHLNGIGIDLMAVTPDEVQRLGANILSLGDKRVLSAADNGRVNVELARRGYRVVAVEVDEFTRCGGGIHCLTLPLSRASAADPSA